MDDTSEPKKFSFPNADRPHPGNLEEAPLDQPHETVHLSEALKIKKEEHKKDLSPIRTFQSDIAGAIKNDNVSVIKMALAEKSRRSNQSTYIDNLPQKQKISPLLVGSIVFLFIILAGGGFYAWSLSKPFSSANTTSTSTPSVSQPIAIFSIEKSVGIDITNLDSIDVINAVKREKPLDLPFGSIKQVYFTRQDDVTKNQTILSSADWFTAINARASDSLSRALDPNYLFGFYAFTPHQTFALFRVNSYDNAYAGMLAWEPYMQDDLGEMFIDDKPANPVSGDASSTSSTTKTIQTETPSASVFVDRVINNKDTRVLLNADGSIRLLYTFIDQKTLLIASSDKVLREITVRLTTGNIIR